MFLLHFSYDGEVQKHGDKILSSQEGVFSCDERCYDSFLFGRIYYLNTIVMQTTCVSCGAEITLAEKIELGEIFSCGDCGTELEVRSLEPLQIEKAPDVGEDWGE